MAAAIPYGVMAGQAIYGYIKNRQAAKAEQQARAQEQSMLTGATGVSNQLTTSGTSLTAAGMPGAQQAGSYYSTLLGGNRAAMAQATAGPRGAITDEYRGATRNLEHSGIQGAGRDLATAELNRDKVGKIAGLTTGVQPQAAAGLADLSTNLVSQGGNRLSAAGGLWGGLLGNRTNARYDAEGTHQATSAAFGRTLFDILSQASRDYSQRGKGVSGLPGGTSGSF